ncbi:cysteine desulfurase family protein [Simkania sp.]|uniref:cysteine desulfurase family protein n=1 Tax=Simkania sp. TaxID=34094 RepID=UPI003B51568E
MKRIYLDHNATTPIAPRVAEAMMQELTKGPQNPSSVHFFGQQAKKTLLTSRQTIARFLKVKPQEILFTSSGTESMNLLIRGSLPSKESHLITTDLDHPCVYENMQSLDQAGYNVTFLSPGKGGAPTPEQVAAALRPNTKLIVLSTVNSETGVKLDIDAIAKIAKDANVPLILDGVALLGKEPFTIPPGVTGMGFSAHKFHGPRGVGFCFLRSGSSLSPLFLGGSQENQLRAGTENLPGIVGLATAIALLEKEGMTYSAHMQHLRDLFEKTLIKSIPNLQINGAGPRIANTSNLCIPGVDGESLLIHLDMKGIAASHATACSAGAMEVSRVLLNMGLSKEEASCSLRFSFSRMNTEEEVIEAAQVISDAAESYTRLPQ